MKRRADVSFRPSELHIRTSFHPAFSPWITSVVPNHFRKYIPLPPTWIIFLEPNEYFARKVYENLDKFFHVFYNYTNDGYVPGWAYRKEEEEEKEEDIYYSETIEGNIFSNRFKPKNAVEIAIKVLELPPNPTKEIVRSSYRRLARLYHPDLNDGGEDKMREINAAYKILLEELQ